MFTPELSAAFAACAEYERLRLELNLARATEDAAAAQLEVARNRLAVEAAEVDALESVTPTRVWATLRGTRASEVERERGERMAAEAAVAELERTYDAARRSCAELLSAILALGDVYRTQERALAVEEGRLLDAGGGAAAQLVEISGQLASVATQRAQLANAKVAAKAAADALNDAARELASADGWSAYDTFFGGGMISSSVKHDHLDVAGGRLVAAGVALTQLSTEVAEVGLVGAGGLQVDDLTRTVDVWFDNFLTDWFVSDQISEARERTADASARVAAVLAQIAAKVADLDALESRLKQAREDVIIQR
ncbi:MAG: hypothetical protein CVT62_10115 [Actinobacteria bacterium HGW-Actinobacteria-2]|nr:MAG: hypothetical protein CVT62_10115 [Actinobacteria bacterium HGW-Actinobacteria-2]